MAQGGVAHQLRALRGCLDEHYELGPDPASAARGQPHGISHPMVYMISSRSKHPALAFRLLVHASAADLNAQHAVQARRLAPLDAVQFVAKRLRQQLRNQVRIVE